MGTNENEINEVNIINASRMQTTQKIDLSEELEKNIEECNKKNNEQEDSKEMLLNQNIQQNSNSKIDLASSQQKENNNLTSENIKCSQDTIVLKDIKNFQEKINNTIEEEKKQETVKINNINEFTEQEKQKKYTQDKKDFKLEKMLFDRINAMQSKIKESIELIKKFERINAKEENLPNIVTTLHDKLTQEVIKQCRTVGIEFNMKSYLVQAMVSDLLEKFEEGIFEFRECSKNLDFVRKVQDDFESRVELVSTSKVKNLIARLRGLFKPERKQEKLEQLERERQEKKLEEANIHLIKYKFKNSELERYTIKNNIVNSLSKEIMYGSNMGVSLSMSELIEEKITPEMKKLGLQNLVDKLQENLYSEYKEKYSDIEKQEFLNMQVGIVKRNLKSAKIGVMKNKANTINTQSNNIEPEEIAI
ncbi:MAG: hypothetical protein E7313_05750 [Clostridiales bacterium]|nr:hypothetical protein [Clostridiales bacterium]